jgi:hypothetical protein
MGICTYGCVCTTYTHAYIHVYIHTYMHPRVFIHINISMYTYIHTHTHTYTYLEMVSILRVIVPIDLLLARADWSALLEQRKCAIASFRCVYFRHNSSAVSPVCHESSCMLYARKKQRTKYMGWIYRLLTFAPKLFDICAKDV